MAIGGALIAVQILLTVPGVLQLFRENPPFSVARMVTIGFLIAAQALILYIARRRARMYEDFYGYEDDPARAVTAAQHAETMGELCHNTAITTTAAGAATAAHAAASEARSEANAAQTSATAARGEAEVAKAEATAAHRGAQEILERIDEATRGTGERAGR